MTRKTTISLTDRHSRYTKNKVQEGVHASVSSLVAAGIEQMMQDEAERDAALQAMQDEIVQRMQTPRTAWIDHQPNGDPMFERIRQRLSFAHKT